MCHIRSTAGTLHLQGPSSPTTDRGPVYSQGPCLHATDRGPHFSQSVPGVPTDLAPPFSLLRLDTKKLGLDAASQGAIWCCLGSVSRTGDVSRGTLQELAVSLSHTHLRIHSLAQCLAQCLAHTHTLTLSRTLSITLSRTLSITLSRTLSHTVAEDPGTGVVRACRFCTGAPFSQ